MRGFGKNWLNYRVVAAMFYILFYLGLVLVISQISGINIDVPTLAIWILAAVPAGLLSTFVTFLLFGKRRGKR